MRALLALLALGGWGCTSDHPPRAVGGADGVDRPGSEGEGEAGPATAGGEGEGEAGPVSAGGEGEGEAPDPDPPGDRVIVGYYPGWAVYGRHYYVHNRASAEDPGVAANTIPAAYYTHINYAFVNISPGGDCMAHDPGAELSSAQDQGGVRGWKRFGPSEGTFADLRALKAANPHVRVLMSVGGWTFSQNFSDVARTEQARNRFARSCVNFMYEHGFDGIDLDWEHPGEGGNDGAACSEGVDCTEEDKIAAQRLSGDGVTYYGLDPNACITCRPEDKDNYVLLLAAVRAELDARHREGQEDKLLTAAVGGTHDFASGLDALGMADHLDWLALMTYDFDGAWDPTTGFHSALHAPDGDWSVAAGVAAYREAGVPAGKLVMGLPYYGRGWANVGTSDPGGAGAAPHGVLDERTGEVRGGGVITGGWEAGSWGWRLLAERYLDPSADPPFSVTRAGSSYTRYWDEESGVPYLHSSAEDIWIGYDDPVSLAGKAAHAVSEGLRGAMVWDVSTDDCDDTLARALNAALNRPPPGPTPPPGCLDGPPGPDPDPDPDPDDECADPGTGQCWAAGA